ncbi:Putative protein [Zobellia galactanivorans]|uniref:Uncharacterized protein n=1 Tax=Zobellia galactanivorans (strain DSM 12802 / CCUG 47099 / CIP 106680 / NCIMB 13871 / Dsij) TaxID=63186 RepID=G0L8Q3_ZOBGA|nr:Putative protein [Zobellia galactanivorans]
MCKTNAPRYKVKYLGAITHFFEGFEKGLFKTY